MKKYILASIFVLALVLSAVSVAYATENQAPIIDIACVKTAVEKRETAIIAAWDKFYTGAKTALEARKTALMAAWDMADNKQRKQAIQVAWKAFKDARISLKSDLKQERSTAWQTFVTERKVCHAPATGDSPATDMAL